MRSFPWNLYCRRVAGAFAVAMIWIVRDADKGDLHDLAIATGVLIAVLAGCYYWVAIDRP